VEPDAFISMIQEVIQGVEAGGVAPKKPVKRDEQETFKRYSERLVQKLEKKVADHIHPEDSARVFDELPRLFDNAHYTHEYRFRHKDGAYRWMHDEMNLIRDDAGAPREIIGYWMDVTDLKRTEMLLRESEARYRNIFENIIDIFYRTDKDGKIVIVSPAVKEIFGYSPEEVIAKQLLGLYLHPEQREEFLAAYFCGKKNGWKDMKLK
jgi:PAS domain S-box-containing protein